MTTTIIRTNAESELFQTLVSELDKELSVINGNQNDFYTQFNKIDLIKHVVVILADDVPIACGAIKLFDEQSMEVKRMFTHPRYRNKGIASILLQELEAWAKEMGVEKCVLETGKKQPDAIALYQKNGYTTTENYGQYAGIRNSLCFSKNL